jgi:hypothetical protein
VRARSCSICPRGIRSIRLVGVLRDRYSCDSADCALPRTRSGLAPHPSRGELAGACLEHPFLRKVGDRYQSASTPPHRGKSLQLYGQHFRGRAAASNPHIMVAKAELQRIPVVRAFLRALGTIFVERSARGEHLSEREQIKQALARGTSIFIFPEGTFTPVTGLRPFQLGHSRLRSQPVRPSFLSVCTVRGRCCAMVRGCRAGCPPALWSARRSLGRQARRPSPRPFSCVIRLVLTFCGTAANPI